jgi:hypothetical protein
LGTSGSRSEIPGKFQNVVLEKDGEYQLDQSFEKRGSIAESEGGGMNIMHTIKRKMVNWTGDILCRNWTGDILCRNWIGDILCRNWIGDILCRNCIGDILCRNCLPTLLIRERQKSENKEGDISSY